MSNPDPTIAQELLSHQAFLRRLAIDLVGNDAEDLVQDVWQRALERPPHHGRQLRGWLARIARNLAANRWRGESRRSEREERWATEQAAEEELEARFELRKELVGVLDSLSQPVRDTILLRYFEGLAPGDIARRQGTPIATVKTRLRRGLAQLREALDQRYDGERTTWMAAVSALGAPIGGSAGTGGLATGAGVGTGTLVIGGLAMGTMTKVSAVVLVAAAGVFLASRALITPASPVESSGITAVEQQATDGTHVGAEVESPTADPITAVVPDAVRLAEERSVSRPTVAGADVLRVVLEGIAEEDAPQATVSLTGVDEHGESTAEVRNSWPCQGLTSDFNLDLFLAEAKRHGNLSLDELEIEVDHPAYLRESSRFPLSGGVKLANGQTVHEVRVPLDRPVYWPEITIHVRDARTRAHLEDVEIRCAPGAMALWRRPGNQKHYPSIGDGLPSPIAIVGGYDADDPDAAVAGVALSPAEGDVPRFHELRLGSVVYARAPGYAWNSVHVNFSSGDEYEVLLAPDATLTVHLTNVQLERYAAIEKKATVGVHRLFPNGNEGFVWFQGIDERLAADGLRLDGLKPGDYSVFVKLGERGPSDAWSMTKRSALSREEVTLAAGESRELLLRLDDPPLRRRERATLAGVVSFPLLDDGHEWVRLDLFEAMNSPVSMLSLEDMERTGDRSHAWSFRIEDLPEGPYQFLLRPFMVSWMVELPPEGREDLELVIPEFAEVLVETVDAGTGERVPLETIVYGLRDLLPDQIHTYQQTGTSFEGEPGRFRFFTKPGAAFLQPSMLSSSHDYGFRRMDLQLVPGPQSVLLELGPRYAIRFEFRENGQAPRSGEDLWWGAIASVRAVEHAGHVTHEGFPGNRIMEVSAPGLYEVSFEGVTAHAYQPIPPRRVDVREGEVTEVIVELQRK